jgi:5-formyltetrahydrofolate cyclo-ligase
MAMTAPDEIKAALRKRAYAARRAAHGATAAAGSVEAATRHLLAEIGPLAGAVISGYMPIRTEIDPRPAMTALAARNHLCVPVIEAAGLPLRFRAWTPGADLVEGPFGALVPAAGAWLEPEILITPLVGFDGRGNRLGYGGGYYDRTLQRLRAARPTRAIGFAYAAQELPSLPVEPTDQPLDALVTEQGVIRP